MAGILEARYIQVIWQDKHSAKKVVEAADPLVLERQHDGTVQVAIVAYSQLDDGRAGQFAVRLAPKCKDTPKFLRHDGSLGALIPVTDPVTGKVWWVEGNTWDDCRQRWLSDMYRGVGQAVIQVGTHVCRVQVSTSTFNFDQLSRYLQDFRHDFWELILNDASLLNGPVKQDQVGLADERTLAAIRRFVDCVDRVLRKPKLELREEQKQLPRKSVRPVARTFMELSTRGDSRTLTSRAFAESLDVPDNRYAHYAVRKVFQITRALCTVSMNQSAMLERNLGIQRQRLAEFKDFKVINKEAALLDHLDNRKKFAALQQRCNALSQSLHQPFGSANSFSAPQQLERLRLKPTKQAERFGEHTFFARIDQRGDGKYVKPSDGYITVDFGALSEIAKEGMRLGLDYQVQGHFEYQQRPQNYKIRHHYRLVSIQRAQILRAERVEKEHLQIERLERSGWRAPLTRDEREQQAREIRSIEQRCTLLEQRMAGMGALGKELRPKLPLLRAQVQAFERAGVRPEARFTNSMTYVQNPAYQGLHASYNLLKLQAGVDDDEILLALDRIEEIGLVNVSMLYERWCLLQLFKVLIHNFDFRPETGWKRKLIAQVLKQGRNVQTVLTNSATLRKIRVSYELELTNGKRPDFVIDAYAKCESSGLLNKRFVLDAKFYQDINSQLHGGLAKVVQQLYLDKDYSEGGKNWVFVLHPSEGACSVRSTPQAWAKDCHYGETHLAVPDDEDAVPPRRPDHRFGGLLLSPVTRGNHLEPLHRALGMFLQYGLEVNRLGVSSQENGAMTRAKPFCLSCGSANQSLSRSPVNQKAWWVTCNDCKHLTVYNYCGACNNRLIKNGSHWSYHAFEPLEPFNIRCPRCGDSL